jgi:1-deoxy-D-xylulose-5-phosphate reductoisomerase
MLRLAFDVSTTGGTAPAVYNAANEVAVAAFLNRKIPFTGINDIVERTVTSTDTIKGPGLEDILAVDAAARETAGSMIEEIHSC